MSIFEHIITAFNDRIDSSSSRIESLTPYLAEASHLIAETLVNGGKILCASAPDASASALHFCQTMTSGLKFERPPLPAVLLHANPLLSSRGTHELAQQVELLATEGKDLLLLIATDTDNAGLIETITAAQEKQLSIILVSNSENNAMATMIGSDQVNIPLHEAMQAKLVGLQFLVCSILSEVTEQIVFGAE